MSRRFIDTNILLRLLTRDDERKAAAALALMRRVERGEERIPFADAYNAAYMESRGINEIYSWDTDFDDLPGIVRVEP